MQNTLLNPKYAGNMHFTQVHLLLISTDHENIITMATTNILCSGPSRGTSGARATM